MLDLTFETICLAIVIGYSIFGWLVLTNIKLNYGRLKNSLLSIDIPPRLSWFLFELPNLIWVIYFLFFRKDTLTLSYSLFIIHYINRDIIYPLRLKSPTALPLEIVLSAFSFTLANGYLQSIANQEHTQVSVFRSVAGVIVFALGMGINIHSDNILQEAKQKVIKEEGKNKYAKIDRFLFQYISNPNYLGEIIQWIGFAISGGHLYNWLFVFSTINILTPGAIARNRWNKSNITGYPSQRKGILPFLL